MSLKDKLWQIYTGDYSQVGYDIGAKQAQDGKPRTFFSLVSKINMINHAGWQNKHAYQTMRMGINKGYDDKLLAQNMVQTFNRNLQGATMTRNYDDILNGLRTAKNNVEMNIEHLTTYMKQYKGKVKDMEDAGFLTNYTDNINGDDGLDTLIEDLKALLKEVIEQLNSITGEVEEDKEQSKNKPTH